MIAGKVAQLRQPHVDPPAGAGSVAKRARLLARPLAISLAVHVLALAVLAVMVSGGARTFAPDPVAPFHATLTTAAQKFIVPEPPAEPLPSTGAMGPLPGPEPALLPVPLKPPPARTAPKAAAEGRVQIDALGASEAALPATEALVASLHPDAVRTAVEFEVPPSGVYPKSAVAGLRQLNVTVAVVTDEEGRVELLQGSYDDPMFTPAIKAALATAKARVLEVDGRPRSSWSLLSFMFEYVGAP